MGEFRIGRTFARHSYPETPARAAALALFARNAALFVEPGATSIPIPADHSLAPITWSFVEIGAPGDDVPITPRSTGSILITGMMTIDNNPESSGSAVVVVQIKLDGGLAIEPFSTATVPEGSRITIPFTVALSSLSLSPHNIRVLLSQPVTTADGLTIFPGGSTLSIQEVPIATG